MLLIENTVVHGWEAALRGMRNPLNSWAKSDTAYTTVSGVPIIGKNDLSLCKRLCEAGSEHRKFLRYITVTFDITAPMYWLTQLDTYKVGTVRNSTSKMHKLLHKPFDMDDFETDELQQEAQGVLQVLIDQLNNWRERYLKTPQENVIARHDLWNAVLTLLPESYRQKSTMLVNYEVLRNIYRQRKNHKLGLWHEFCAWIAALPYATELLTGGD